jgi:DinB superfamily
MTNVKELLLKQTAEAFDGRSDMSIKAALEGITPDQAIWRADESMPTTEQLVRHVAWAKSHYCAKGFGAAMVLDDPNVNDDGDAEGIPWEFPCGAAYGSNIASGIEQAVELLDRSHRVLVQCLESCTEESLQQPIPNRHGKSAVHFFWIMIMHDAYHAGQIRTRRKLSQTQQQR